MKPASTLIDVQHRIRLGHARKAQLIRELNKTPESAKLCLPGIGWVYRRNYLQLEIWHKTKKHKRRGSAPKLIGIPWEVIAEESMRMARVLNAEWQAEKEKVGK